MMNAIQLRHGSRSTEAQDWHAYVDHWIAEGRDAHYACPPMQETELTPPATGGDFPHEIVLTWRSAVVTQHEANNRVRASIFVGPQGYKAPTVLMLHALMSASDIGYRNWAKRFQQRGWNAVFIHLPYHYSRRPAGHLTGELAITSDLLRTAEGLRQGVIDLRQLMAFLRERGCPGFGMWATSYGGWIGSLLASVESDFQFLALLEPIVNVDHAIWKSPAGRTLSAQIRKKGITAEDVARHFPIASPMHARPLADGKLIYLVAGEHDAIALPGDIQELSRRWTGAHYRVFPQGHLGYTLMRESFLMLEREGIW